MSRSVFLESFDTGDMPQPATGQSNSPEFERGFAAGQEAATTGFAAQQADLSVELVQTLADARFGYQEARAAILAGLSPLLNAVVHKVLPQLTDAAFAPRIVEAILATSPLPTDIAIYLHPQQMNAIQSSIGAEMQVRCIPDPSLGHHEALVMLSDSEINIDMGRLHDEIAAILQTMTSLSQRNSRIG